MSTERELLARVFDHLSDCALWTDESERYRLRRGIEKLLAEPEQEPVACNFIAREGRCDGFLWEECTVCRSTEKLVCKQNKLAPVAWKFPLAYGSGLQFSKPVKPDNWDDSELEWYCVPLYTKPPRQEPVYLSDDIRKSIANSIKTKISDGIYTYLFDYANKVEKAVLKANGII